MTANGVVRIDGARGKLLGSGVLVSGRMVVTCEHVVRRVRKVTVDGVGGRVAHADRERDLALVELDDAVDRAPVGWMAAGAVGDRVACEGFSGKGLEEREVRLDEICPRFTWLGMASNLPEGTSGGGVFRQQGAGIYCVGLIEHHQHMVKGSRAHGAARVRKYCAEHGITLADGVAATPAARKAYHTERYFDWLRGFAGQIDFRGLKTRKEVQAYPMDELYIPLRAAGAGGGAVPLEDALGGYTRLVIQGAAGSGKTTFLRYVAWTQCQQGEGFPMFVSIARLDSFIEARKGQAGYPVQGDAPGWIACYLENEGSSEGREWGLDREFFLGKLRDADTTVLLDGLDEAGSQGRREAMARLFEGARTAYPRCQWVVTTRPGAYEGKATLAGFGNLRIEELEPEQISDFLRRWSLALKDGHEDMAREHCASLERALAKSPWEIRRMARNPLMLSALAVVHYNDGQLPDQRADLYESIVGWLALSRRTEKADGELLLKQFGYLAFRMQDAKGKYLTRMARGTAGEWLEEKFGMRDGAEFLAKETVDSGIVTSEGDAEVRFYHRSYQEYLAGRYLAKERSKVRWEEVRTRLDRPEWTETLVLMAGCLHASEGTLVDFLEELLGFARGQERFEARARVVGLVAAMLADLRAAKFELGGAVAQDYQTLLRDARRVFEVGGAPELGVKTRAAVADALGVAGHPGLYLPGDEQYWVEAQGVVIGRYPVTVWEYSRFVDAGGERPYLWDEQTLTPSRPVVRVSWDQAVAYCGWVKGVRLPKEKEWQRVASGKGQREYPWGNEEPDDSRANYQNNIGAPSAVGLFPASATEEGVMDMAGNVWEWTATDVGKEYKAVRGGAFSLSAVRLRAADRLGGRPVYRSGDLGFRLVRE